MRKASEIQIGDRVCWVGEVGGKITVVRSDKGVVLAIQEPDPPRYYGRMVTIEWDLPQPGAEARDVDDFTVEDYRSRKGETRGFMLLGYKVKPKPPLFDTPDKPPVASN